MWQLYHPLAALTMQARVEIKESVWLAKAREFGLAYIAAYPKEKVTTYMHIFVYHYRFFLSRYNGIEKFTNYALEGKHKVTKRILVYGTSGLGGRSNGDDAQARVARQQLEALLHDEVHAAKRQRKGELPSNMQQRPKTWAERSLSVCGDLTACGKSSTHT